MWRSAEPKQRRLCPICPGSVQELRADRLPAVCSCSWEPLRDCGAEGRQLRAGSSGQARWGREPSWDRLGRVGGGRDSRAREAGWTGAGFKEGVGEGPSDTEQAPVFLVNLWNRSVAEQ